MPKDKLKRVEVLVHETKELILRDRNQEAYTNLREVLDIVYQILYKDRM